MVAACIVIIQTGDAHLFADAFNVFLKFAPQKGTYMSSCLFKMIIVYYNMLMDAVNCSLHFSSYIT